MKSAHVGLAVIERLDVIKLAPIIAPGKKQWKRLTRDVKNLLKLMSL